MPPSAPSSARRYDLDWIRVGAFGLLILYHVGLVYGVYGWHVHSVHTFEWMREAILITNPWRLNKSHLTRLRRCTIFNPDAWRTVGCVLYYPDL